MADRDSSVGAAGSSEHGTLGAATQGAATPGAATPGAATPGAATPGAATPGTATPGAAAIAATTPGGDTVGAATPGASTPGVATLGGATPDAADLGDAMAEATSSDAAAGAALDDAADEPPPTDDGGAAGARTPGAPAWDLVPTPALSSAVEWPWKTQQAADSAAVALASRAEAGGAVDAGLKPEDAPSAVAQPSPSQSSAPEAQAVLAPDMQGESAPELSFERSMWGRLEALWAQRIEPSQKVMEQFAQVLKSRAELERKYGESLRSMAAEVKVDPEAGSVQAAVDAAMVNFRNRGEQSIELAEQVDQDIVVSLEAVIKQHRDVSQRIFTDVQLLTKYCQDKHNAHEKLARRYSARCLEAELAAQECLQGVTVRTADRLKMAQKVTHLSKQARTAEHEYYASIDQANMAQALYDKHMPLVLATLQDLEEKRGKCIKDCLMKLAVYETSWLRNLQYDIEAVVKVAESADVCKDLQEFLQAHTEAAAERRLPQPPLVPRAFWLCGRQPQPHMRLSPMARQQLEAHSFIRRMWEDEVGPVMHILLAEDAAASAPEDCRERTEQLRQGLGDARRRAALCLALRSEVLAREPPPGAADVDLARGAVVSQATLDALAPLAKAALDACDEQADTWCGRDLMVLVSLIRADSGQGKLVSLLSRVYNHALWNRVTFWEEVLLIGLCEAHATEAVSRRSLPPGSLFTEPAMTAFLQRFLGYMMAFGISFDQARNSVWSTIRKHTTMLGSSCKPYANLLMQAYEEAARGPGAGGLTGPGSVPPEGAAEAAAARASPLAAPPGVPEDDFEAVALGIPVGSCGGAQDSGDEEEPGPDAEQGDGAPAGAQEVPPPAGDASA